MMKTTLTLCTALLLSGCANHPLDCAVGFHHSDCLPGTAGYNDPSRFAAQDDAQCRSFGLTPGTQPYADCRIKLTTGREHGILN